MKEGYIHLRIDSKIQKYLKGISLRLGMKVSDTISLLVVNYAKDTKEIIIDEEIRRDLEVRKAYKKMVGDMRINMCLLRNGEEIVNFAWRSYCIFGEVDIDYVEKMIINAIAYQDALNINRINCANILGHNFRSLTDRNKLDIFISSAIKRKKEELRDDDEFFKRRKK